MLHTVFSAFLVLIFIFPSATFSQKSTIKGVVSHGQTPVPFASVGLEGTQYGTTTEIDGTFSISEIPAGTYKLQVAAVGYRTERKKIVVGGDESKQISIALNEDLLNLEEVVVSGTRYAHDRENAPVLVNLVDDKLLAATQSLAVSEGLNFQPGVRVETNCQNCGFTQVRMNGLPGGYSQILINSRPIFSALNSVYGLDQIPTNIVERIEVVRSGGSALYGSNAIAGTINIITKEPVENAWEIRSNTALIASEAFDQTFTYNASIVSEELTSGVTIYGMNRNRESFDANGDGFTELVALENNAIGAKAFYKPTIQSKLSVDLSTLQEYRRGGDRLELAPHFTDITEELTHRTFLGGVNYELWNLDDSRKLSLYSSMQQTDRDSFYGGLGGGRTEADSTLALNAYGGTEDLALVSGFQIDQFFSNKDVLTFGIENQYYNTVDEIQGYGRTVDQEVRSLGFYSQYEWQSTSKLTTLLGARYDFTRVDGIYQVGSVNSTSDVSVGVFSPRVTLLYNVKKNIRIRAGYARGFRAPQAFNEDLHISSVGGEPLFVVLSDDLDKETSDAFTASLNMSKSWGLAQSNFVIEGFHTLLQDPFTQVSTGSVLDNGSIVEEVRNGSGASVSGVNFEAGYSSSSSFSLQVGGTLQQTRYNEPQVLFEAESQSAGEESSVVIQEFARTPTMYGYFTTFYSFSKKWKIDITGSYTGTMIVPRVVSDTGFLQLINSQDFMDINFKVSHHIELAEDFHIELSGGLKNALNSFQDNFDVGPERDSDFIFGPAAPRSVFLTVKIGNLH